MAKQAINDDTVTDMIDNKIIQVLGFSDAQRNLILQRFDLE